MKSSTTISIPKAMESYYTAITALTDDYCSKNLNEEYAQLSRLATAALCRKKLSPLQIGSVATWACGIIYAVGYVNFLFDRSTIPYVTAADLAGAFGISKSTAGNKSKQVRDLLKMKHFDHNWRLPSRIEKSPMIWNIMYNGLIVDARRLPREAQVIAYKKGLIPYIHADKQNVMES